MSDAVDTGDPDLVRYQVHSGVAEMTLDAPARRNALSRRLVTELQARLGRAVEDPAVRTILISHTGRTFCAGLDLTESRAEGGPGPSTARLLALLRAIVECPKPVVAQIDGHCRAGGLGLVGACDIAVAGPRATFAFTEVRLGLAPAVISLTTLGRMSPRSAARYCLTGEIFGPDEARAAGLITFAADDAAATVSTVVAGLGQGSPQGLEETKRLLTAPVLAAFDQHSAALQELSARLFGSAEASEGMEAFLARRPPRWQITSWP